MVNCSINECIKGTDQPTLAFRSFLECIIKGVSSKIIIVDNGQQFTWMAYIEVDKPESLKEISDYLINCLDNAKGTVLSGFTSNVKIIRGEDQLILVFDKEIVTVKTLMA